MGRTRTWAIDRAMRYELRAVNARNEVVALRLEAASDALARELARRQGYEVIGVSGPAIRIPALTGRRGRFPTALFSAELLALLDAGLNLVEALQALLEKERTSDAQRVLEAVVANLREGLPLSAALGSFPEHFSDLYVATIRSSERTGDLKEALARFIAYDEELDKVRRKVIAAAIYPAILLAVGTLVFGFLLFYVVPRFARVYEDVAIDLPFFSSVLLAIGQWIEHHGLLALASLAGGGAVLVHLLAQPDVRARLGRRLWQLPALGERMKTYQLARLYRTLAMLVRAGVPIVQATEMAHGLLAPHLKLALHRAASMMTEGQSVSAAMTEAGLATAVGSRMLRVGETGGRVGDMMERIARFHDDETARFLDTFMRALEPALMAFLGLAVGMVVVMMYMPIFELAGSLQ